MFIRIFITGLFLTLLSCKKVNDSLTEKAPAIELLTQKLWILVSHGLDDNRNDKIDPAKKV